MTEFLDSSAWLAYFFAYNKQVQKMIESNTILFASVISIFEVKKKLITNNYKNIQIQKAIDFISQRSILIELTKEICENAAEISAKKKLHAIDSLIYASSLDNNCILVTGDSDFEGLDKVSILPKFVSS